MVSRPHARRLAVGVVVAISAAFVTLTGPSRADVTAVQGSAYGYFSSVGLFGGPPNINGPTPTVSLPPGGSATPITATAATGQAGAGPARFFTSGQIDVSTQGTPGATGSVMSSARVQNLTNLQGEVFTATDVRSNCSASETGISGSTVITGGMLQTDSGDDSAGNVHPAVVVPVPVAPAPNTVISGHLHVNGARDDYSFTFNEQIISGNSITVNAVHQRFIGPTAVGDLIIGQSVCTVTVVPNSTTTPTSAPASTTPTTSPTSTTPTSTTPTSTTPTSTTPTSTTPTSTTPTSTTPTTSPTTSTTPTTSPTTSTTPTTSPTTSTTATTVPPTTSTTATTVPPTTSTTATTVPPTTSTTATTVPPTTSTSTTTTAPTTSSSTSTTISTNDCVARLQATRAETNARIDISRAQVIGAVPPGTQRDALLAQLEAARAQANAQIDRAIATCP